MQNVSQIDFCSVAGKMCILSETLYLHNILHVVHIYILKTVCAFGCIDILLSVYENEANHYRNRIEAIQFLFRLLNIFLLETRICYSYLILFM